jgi:hypothetical protein
MNHARGWASERADAYRDLRFRTIVWGAATVFCVAVWGFVIYALVHTL